MSKSIQSLAKSFQDPALNVVLQSDMLERICNARRINPVQASKLHMASMGNKLAVNLYKLGVHKSNFKLRLTSQVNTRCSYVEMTLGHTQFATLVAEAAMYLHQCLPPQSLVNVKYVMSSGLDMLIRKSSSSERVEWEHARKRMHTGIVEAAFQDALPLIMNGIQGTLSVNAHKSRIENSIPAFYAAIRCLQSQPPLASLPFNERHKHTHVYVRQIASLYQALTPDAIISKQRLIAPVMETVNVTPLHLSPPERTKKVSMEMGHAFWALLKTVYFLIQDIKPGFVGTEDDLRQEVVQLLTLYTKVFCEFSQMLQNKTRLLREEEGVRILSEGGQGRGNARRARHLARLPKLETLTWMVDAAVNADSLPTSSLQVVPDAQALSAVAGQPRAVVRDVEGVAAPATVPLAPSHEGVAAPATVPLAPGQGHAPVRADQSLKLILELLKGPELAQKAMAYIQSCPDPLVQEYLIHTMLVHSLSADK